MAFSVFWIDVYLIFADYNIDEHVSWMKLLAKFCDFGVLLIWRGCVGSMYQLSLWFVFAINVDHAIKTN